MIIGNSPIRFLAIFSIKVFLSCQNLPHQKREDPMEPLILYENGTTNILANYYQFLLYLSNETDSLNRP